METCRGICLNSMLLVAIFFLFCLLFLTEEIFELNSSKSETL